MTLVAQEDKRHVIRCMSFISYTKKYAESFFMLWYDIISYRNERRDLMKRCLYTLLILILFISGCQSKGLINYQQAIETTHAIETGKVVIEVEMENTFNEDGLSVNELKEINVGKSAYSKVTTIYDTRDRNFLKEQMHIYYMVGGMGFDSWIYLEGEDINIKIPMLDVYMTIEDFQDELSQDIDVSNISLIFDDILKKWIDIFEEENIVDSKDKYIITSKGQVKTTSYNFYLSKSQISQLLNDLIEDIDRDELNAYIIYLLENYLNNDIIYSDIVELLDQITIYELKGVANVDFNNQLIQQKLILLGEYENSNPGEIDKISLEVTFNFEDLGKEVMFDFPILTKENTVTEEELDDLFEDLKD